MFDGWTKPKFYTKCKSAVRHTRTRVEAIKKKRLAVEKFLKKDVADLLRGGLDYNAYLRADMLLVEQNMTACYDIVEQSCDCVSNHLSDMQSEKECPLACREAASSLAYAAARFADLPDLRQLRTLFTDRYGSSFESFANKEFVKKLKADPPTKDMKLQLLHNVAQEFSVDWDSKALEQKLFTPPPDQQDQPKHYPVDESNDKWHKNKDKYKDEPRRDGFQLNGIDANEVRAEPARDGRTSSSSMGTTSEDDAENQKPSYRFMDPPYTKPSHDNADEPKPKPKPRSVRRRRPLSNDNAGTGTGTTDGNDKRDEEEKVLDGLLLHYSNKKSTYDEGRVKTALEENGRPRTAKSMPASEIESPGSEVKKAHVHARSSSIELGGHVHPRMPDYEELAARIAALRGTT